MVEKKEVKVSDIKGKPVSDTGEKPYKLTEYWGPRHSGDEFESITNSDGFNGIAYLVKEYDDGTQIVVQIPGRTFPSTGHPNPALAGDLFYQAPLKHRGQYDSYAYTKDGDMKTTTTFRGETDIASRVRLPATRAGWTQAHVNEHKAGKNNFVGSGISEGCFTIPQDYYGKLMEIKKGSSNKDKIPTYVSKTIQNEWEKKPEERLKKAESQLNIPKGGFKSYDEYENAVKASFEKKEKAPLTRAQTEPLRRPPYSPPPL